MNSGVDFVEQGDWSGWLFSSPVTGMVGAGMQTGTGELSFPDPAGEHLGLVES